MTAPEQLSIDTPEQIALEFPLAGVGSRFLALAIDMLLQVGDRAVLVPRGGRSARGRSLRSAVGSARGSPRRSSLAGFLLFYGYFAAFEAFWHGQTPGKRLRRPARAQRDRAPVPLRRSILRNLLRVVDQLPGVYAVGIVTMLLSRRATSGSAISRPAPSSCTSRACRKARCRRRRSSPRGSAPRGSASRKSRSSRRFSPGARTCPRYLRMHTAGQLANRIRQRLELPAGTQRDDEALIETIAAEYRRR